MIPRSIEETAKCKKCGEQHRVDEYRGVKHYVCPEKNIVLLLVQDETSNDSEKQRLNP